MSKLVIVESPAKSRTLKKFLGRKFKIFASGGHLVDLPKNTLAVDLKNDFKPRYRVIPGKKKIVKELKKAAENAEEIYLASDPDREGEAIAWHIARLLKADDEHVYRAVFNEITRKAVLNGINNPMKIDENKVNAQQARRVLDRLVGYKVSPVLWYALYKGLSAGRVQSVALRLICEKEAEVQAFVPQQYYEIKVQLEYNGKKFWANLDKIDGKKVKVGTIPTKEDAERIIKEIEQKGIEITSLRKRKTKKKPTPPFKTSTLQLRAHSVLGFSASRTMRIAQGLYEGIDLGKEGHAGIITYMRTDSIRLSDDAIKNAAEVIAEQFGEKYLNSRQFKTSKKAQDAHEAIRPTNPGRNPKNIEDFLNREQLRLYNLIYSQFMASQMSEAIYEEITIKAESGKYSFKAQDSILQFEGFLKMFPKRLSKEKAKKALIPSIPEGSAMKMAEKELQRKETSPPARYSEGTLVQELEKNGVGRPSTYAQIISTLFHRNYVNKADGKLIPTKLGIEVQKILVDKFPDLFQVNFTAHMESDLDEVEEGKKDWISLLREFYNPFEEHLKEVLENRKELKEKYEEKTDKVCEKCGSPMIVKWGPHGKFLACSGFPECKNAQPLEEEQEKLPDHIKNMKCPKCGKAVTVKHARRGPGRFIGCTGYPDCDFIAPFYLGFDCPETDCDGQLIERVTKRGRTFVGCSNYPKCEFASWDIPVDEKCPKCETVPLFKKKSKKKSFKYCPNPECDWAEEGHKKPRRRKSRSKSKEKSTKE
ncbi:MAG: type I DNA topoisomerase [Candidatus Zixiibacteriota bacterium]